ncbi:hypothetical protein ACEWY4_001401 [Coilia grayii]|uniref:Beta-microseminoprotein n=1 Tax=Coilia grayii TaxID=363190 RepID=A0ABD1KSX2_9TELE
MGSLFRLSVFLCVVAMSYAQCYFEPIIITDITKLPTGCQDSKGDLHPFGSKWMTEGCYSCSCSEDGASCCNQIPQIVKSPPDCQLLVDKKTCTSKLVLKSDTSVACPTGGVEKIL